MRNYIPKRPSDAPPHTLSKLCDVSVGFMTPPIWGSVLLYLRSPKGGCCSISDDLSWSSLLTIPKSVMFIFTSSFRYQRLVILFSVGIKAFIKALIMCQVSALFSFNFSYEIKTLMLLKAAKFGRNVTQTFLRSWEQLEGETTLKWIDQCQYCLHMIKQSEACSLTMSTTRQLNINSLTLSCSTDFTVSSCI